MFQNKVKSVFALSLLALFNLTLCLELINQCTTNCTAESGNNDKSTTIIYSIQDKECEGLDEYNKNPDTIFVTDPASHLESNNSALTANLQLRLSDTSAQYVGGFEILAVVASLYEDQNNILKKYICLKKGFSFKEVEFRTNRKFRFKDVKFPLNFSDMNPGDLVTFNVFYIPRSNKTIMNTCERNRRGWKKCIRELKFPTCSDPIMKNSSNHYCQLERNVTILIESSGCRNKPFNMTTVFPKELATTAQLHILDENKMLVHLQNVTHSNQTHTISLSSYRLNQTYHVVLNISNQLLESPQWSFTVNSCKSTVLDSTFSVLFAVISIGVLCIAVTIMVWVIRKRRASSPHFLLNKQGKQSEALPSNESQIPIYLGYADSREVFEQVIFSFANNLRQNIGIEVHFSPWSIEAEVQMSQWMEKILNECDKFIIVWSLQSVKVFSNPSDFGSTDVEGDIFHGLTTQLKQNLLRNFIDKSKIVSVYFDKKCADQIPEWFRKLVDKHFYLMDQFEELYAYLKDHKKYNPHSKLITNFCEAGFSLEEKIENLRNYNNGCKINKIYSQDSTNNLINDLNIDSSCKGGYHFNNFNEVVPPECTALLTGCETESIDVIPPAFGATPQDLNLSPPGVLQSPPEVLVKPPDFLVKPPDSLITPSDSFVISPDFDVMAPDSLVSPPHSFVTPPDSLVSLPHSFVTPPDFNIAPPDSHVFRQDLHLAEPVLNV